MLRSFLAAFLALASAGAGAAPPAAATGLAYRAMPIQGGTAGQPGATGWAHTGVTLATCNQYVSGSDYVLNGTSTPLTVDGCDFLGRMVVIRGNVTLKRSRVRDNVANDCAHPAILIDDNAGPVLIEDVEIVTTDPNAVGGGARMDRTICVQKWNNLQVTIRRVWAHESMRGMDFTQQNHVTVEDSYMGPNVSPPTGYPPDGSGCPGSERAHSSAIRAAGDSHDILLHNTVLHLGTCSWDA